MKISRRQLVALAPALAAGRTAAGQAAAVKEKPVLPSKVTCTKNW